MNETRLTELRHVQGWTQERLSVESGVAVRTIQRLEAGHDASLETLSLIADALHVPVASLFRTIDNDDLSTKVESLDSRAKVQQASRDREFGAWSWLYVGIGIVVSLLSFAGGTIGATIFIAYWSGGLVILIAARRLYLEPRLAAKYPLSRTGRERRTYPVRHCDAPAPTDGVDHA